MLTANNTLIIKLVQGLTTLRMMKSWFLTCRFYRTKKVVMKLLRASFNGFLKRLKTFFAKLALGPYWESYLLQTVISTHVTVQFYQKKKKIQGNGNTFPSKISRRSPPFNNVSIYKSRRRRLPKGINDNVLAFKNYEKLRGEKVSRVW